MPAEPEADTQIGREERFFIGWSEQVSRKGFFARFGRLVLTIVGVSFVPILPVDRIVRDAEACDPTCASTWYLCGLCGTLCCSGCTGGASYQTCPSCTTQGPGPAWSFCCVTGSTCNQINYLDCCTQNPGTCSCPGTCLSCSEGCPQISWCPTGDGWNYVCSVALNRGPCSPGSCL
jgi:hypothetical protein